MQLFDLITVDPSVEHEKLSAHAQFMVLSVEHQRYQMSPFEWDTKTVLRLVPVFESHVIAFDQPFTIDIDCFGEDVSPRKLTVVGRAEPVSFNLVYSTEDAPHENPG